MKLFYWHYGVIISSLATAVFHILCYPYFGWLDSIVLNGFGSLALLAAYFFTPPGPQKIPRRHLLDNRRLHPADHRAVDHSRR